MLNGKELGAAIEAAIERKIAAGSIKSKTDVARHFGVRPASVHGWIKTGAISKDKLPELWRYFSDVTEPAHWGLSSWPFQQTIGTPKANKADSNVREAAALRGRVPVISSVQAGNSSDIVDNFAPGEADEWLEVGVPVKRHTFALIVEGESMEPEFTEGMRIVVEPDMPPEIGDYVVAGNGEQATLKKLVRDGNDLYLKPLNPNYPTKPLGNARIIGVVREATKKFR